MTERTPEFGTPHPASNVVIRSAAYVVVRDAKDRILVVRAKPGLFLPGGGAQSGETPDATVMREVLEELGTTVALHRRLGNAVQHFSANGIRYKMNAVFFAGSVREQLLGSGEHEFAWMDVESLMSDLYHECHAWGVRLALEDVSK